MPDHDDENESYLRIYVGQTAPLRVRHPDPNTTYGPGSAVHQEVEWASDDESVVTVSSGPGMTDGDPTSTVTITGVGVGTAMVTASAGGHEAEFHVGVVAGGEIVIEPIPMHH